MSHPHSGAGGLCAPGAVLKLAPLFIGRVVALPVAALIALGVASASAPAEPMSPGERLVASLDQGGGRGPGAQRGGRMGGQMGGMRRNDVRREIDQSVHRGASCSDCHGHDGHKPWKVSTPDLATSCGSCHEQEWDDYRAHAHGRSMFSGDQNAPSCVDCHGSHSVQSRLDIGSSTNFARAPSSCGECHNKVLDEYTSGAHGNWWPGVPASNAATCTSCHTPHATDGADVRSSSVSRTNLAMTCGQCHTDEFHAYQPSVHAQALQAGNIHAASCTDCHGIHDTHAIGDPSSPLDTLALAEQTCAQCHASVELTEMHDLEIGVVGDFKGSFHGLAIAGGDRTVANCASCHGSHDIRPSSDPASSIFPGNLGATCGSCHPGAGVRFASGGVHHLPINWGHRLVDTVRVMYVILIVSVLGGMALHNAIDFRRRWIDRRARARAGAPDEAPGRQKSFVRFTIGERIQHWTLAGSFTVLVISGFALKFVWGVPFVNAADSETVRALVHRGAATLFMALAVYHVGYLVVSKRGRSMARAMLPRVRSWRDTLCAVGCCIRLGPASAADWRDLLQMVRYNLGLTPERPRFGRFSYAEKMEYLALVWGSLIMIATGLILWFEVPFLNRVPFWGFQLATLVHYFEAILATLAIVVWHFYFTMLNPDVFPLSKVMITGKISRHEMELDHAHELESLESPGHTGACDPDAAKPGAESPEDERTP